MKKLLIFAAGILVTASLFAGGLVTNTNQSASWVRLPARDASTSIDAVYFNPAGLMKLNNGFHLSLSNQTIWQNREITNDYGGPGGLFGLNNNTYTGEVFAPFFPGVYGVYKMDKLAFSFGFNPVGGGGGATYAGGLPSFDIGPSDLVPALAPTATAYSVDMEFEGTSVFFGYQGGVSYQINDLISVFAGVRYVTAKNTYMGHLTDIELNYGGAWTRADAIMTGISNQAAGAATGMQPLIDGGAGSLTFAAAQSLTIIDAATRAQLEGGLLSFGVSQAAIDAMSLATAQATYQGFAARYSAQSTLLNDKEADVEQTASGVTPIIGINISPSENLNIGIKYEFATKLEFTNMVNDNKDILTDITETGELVYMFVDGSTFNGDMPAMLSLGVDYGVSEDLRVSVGTHYYFDKSSNYGKKVDGEYVDNDVVIDNNYMEFAGGLEYDLTDKLLVSAGYLLAKTGVNDLYQSDLSYSLTSNTIGFGGAFKLNDNIVLNLGFGLTTYKDASITIDHEFVDGSIIQATESYAKDNKFVALGLDFSF